MFIVFGACLAGLYLILRDLLPFLAAHRSGVVRTRGYKREAVRRSEDPVRFKALLRNHIDGMVIGLLAVLFGILWTFFGLFALIAIFPIGALMRSMARRSKKPSQRVAEAFD
jgi:hypothetical protein